MALRRMPTRQDPRPGTGDDRYRSDYQPERGGWEPAPQPDNPHPTRTPTSQPTQTAK